MTTENRHDDPSSTGRHRRPLLVFVGNRIRLLRDEQSWNQRQLAAKVGISASLLAKYESGVTEPPLRTLLRIAHCLDVPLGLVADERHGMEPTQNALILARIRQLATLDEHQKLGLLAVLDIILGLLNLVSNKEGTTDAPR